MEEKIAEFIAKLITVITSNESLIAAAIGALIGGVLALISSWVATRTQHKNQLDLAEIEHKKLTYGLLQAIYDELEVYWKIYMQYAGTHIETLEEDCALTTYYPLEKEYFFVYQANAIHISKLSNVDLRHTLIRTYSLASAQADSLRFYSHKLTDLSSQRNTYVIERRFDELKNYDSKIQSTIMPFTRQLNIYHLELKQQMETLMPILNEEIKIWERRC